MNILIIGPADAKDENGNELIQAYKEVVEEGIENSEDTTITTTLLDEILIDISTDELKLYDSRNNRDLSEYDVLLLRGHGFGHFVDIMGVMTLYAEKHGIKMINEYAVVRDSSKLLQNTHFHFNGMNIPRTLYVNRGLLEHSDQANWNFPSVMKQVNGSLGKNNFIVKNWDDVHDIFVREPVKRYIVQEFIPNDGDYRLLFGGDEMLAFKRTSVDDSHLNNTSQGGSAVLVDGAEIPSAIIEQSKLISRQYGMTISGVDVMQDKETGEFYFLEVNMQPQLITGAFLDEKKAFLGKTLKSLTN